MKMKPAELSDRLLDFAVRVGKVVDALPKTRLGRHVAGQLVRCGTSPAPNYEEACAAESRADFIHKLSISLKELRESRFWIRYIGRSELLREKRSTACWTSLINFAESSASQLSPPKKKNVKVCSVRKS